MISLCLITDAASFMTDAGETITWLKLNADFSGLWGKENEKMWWKDDIYSVYIINLAYYRILLN